MYPQDWMGKFTEEKSIKGYYAHRNYLGLWGGLLN